MRTHWIIQGMRPKTLIAGLIPPIISYCYYYKEYGNESFLHLILCALLALFIQISTNFYNDAIDFKKGADVEREGPARAATQLKIDSKHVFRLGHLFIILSFVVGIPLVLKGGLAIGILGLFSLLLAYGYTGGPFPLAYLGLGELFVLLFFGFVATGGSYYIYSGHINLEIILIGAQVGLLSSVLIAINNFRDKESDKKVSKNTLATKLSSYRYLHLIDLFLFLPYIILFYFVVFIDLKYFLL